MIPILIHFIIAIIVAGFLFWALGLLLPLIPMPAEFRGFIDIALKILIVGVVLFYFVIPLLMLLPSTVRF